MAGDVNGDGYDEFMIARRMADWLSVNNSGEVNLIWGGPALPFEIQIDSLDGQNGFTFVGSSSMHLLGTGIGHTDFNNDGYSDLLLGSPGSFSGVSNTNCIVFGGTTPFPPVVYMDSLSGLNTLILHTPNSQPEFGDDFGGGQDVNGDGIQDVILLSLIHI